MGAQANGKLRALGEPEMTIEEAIGLRLYTGPLFEFYNTVLRAKGGTVPFGNRYPALKGEHTGGRFVTTIHAVSPCQTIATRCRSVQDGIQ